MNANFKSESTASKLISQSSSKDGKQKMGQFDNNLFNKSIHSPTNNLFVPEKNQQLDDVYEERKDYANLYNNSPSKQGDIFNMSSLDYKNANQTESRLTKELSSDNFDYVSKHKASGKSVKSKTGRKRGRP